MYILCVNIVFTQKKSVLSQIVFVINFDLFKDIKNIAFEKIKCTFSI